MHFLTWTLRSEPELFTRTHTRCHRTTLLPRSSLYHTLLAISGPWARLWAHLPNLRTSLAPKHGNWKSDSRFSEMPTALSFTPSDVSSLVFSPFIITHQTFLLSNILPVCLVGFNIFLNLKFNFLPKFFYNMSTKNIRIDFIVFDSKINLTLDELIFYDNEKQKSEWRTIVQLTKNHSINSCSNSSNWLHWSVNFARFVMGWPHLSLYWK